MKRIVLASDGIAHLRMINNGKPEVLVYTIVEGQELILYQEPLNRKALLDWLSSKGVAPSIGGEALKLLLVDGAASVQSYELSQI